MMGSMMMGSMMMWMTADAWTVLVRATLLLSGALAGGWVLRKTGAQARHKIWTATFVILLCLPAAVVWLPRLEIPILPARGHEAPWAVAGPKSSGDVGASVPRRSEATFVPETALRTPRFDTGPVVSAAPPVSSGRNTPRALDSASTNPLGRFGPFLALIWALGVLAGFISLAVGLFRFRSLVRQAHPTQDPRIVAQANTIRKRLGIQRHVRILTADTIVTPMAGGAIAPVVVLPADAKEWSQDRLTVVLTHELIHVRRHDALRHILGCAALSVYWFHPLSWLGARLAMVSREEACDEQVVAMGTRPSEYARHLLELATGLTPTPAMVSLPMVQRSQLERRVMSILSSHPTARNTVVTSLAFLAFVAFGVSAAFAIPVAFQTPPMAPIASVSDGERAVPSIPSVPSVPIVPSIVSVPAIPAVPAAPGGSVVFSQEGPHCQAEGASGSFRGSWSTRGNRTQTSGWHNGDRMIQTYVEDVRLCMRMHGEVVLNDDGAGVRALGQDSWVALESEKNELRRLVVTEDASGLVYAWTVDGVSRAFEGDAKEWHDRMFTVLSARWEASMIRGEESSLRGEISSMRGHISSLRGQISSYRGHVSSLNGKISSMHGRISSMNGEISSHRGHVSSLNGQVSSIRGRISSLQSALRSTSSGATKRQLDDEIETLAARIDDVLNEIEDYELEERVSEIGHEVEDYDVHSRVAAVEDEIREYELESKVRSIEQEIEGYHLDERVNQTEQEIEDLDADRRAQEIEDAVASDLRELMRLLNQL